MKDALFSGDDFKSHSGLTVLDFRSTALSRVSVKDSKFSLFVLPFHTHTHPRGFNGSFPIENTHTHPRGLMALLPLSTHFVQLGRAAAFCSCGLSRPTVARGSSPSLPRSQVCKAVAIEMTRGLGRGEQSTTCSGGDGSDPGFSVGKNEAPVP